MRKPTVILFILTSLMYFFVGRHLQVMACIFFKILPLLVLFVSLTLSPGAGGAIPTVQAALVFSMLGDVLGVWKGSLVGVSAFLLQIASFAVAQIFYAVSFTRYFRKDPSLPRNVVRAILGTGLICYLVWFGIYVHSFILEPALRIAVPCYVVLIGTMGLFSIIQCRKGWLFFIAGALLFIFSDSFLAYRSFVGSVPQAGLLIMSAYYAAQLLLNIRLVRQ